MTTQHTSGPWILNGMSVQGIVNNSKEPIATVCSMPCIDGNNDLAAERGMDMEQANARLIASAPDLLAALEAIIKEAPRAGKDERPTGTIDTMVWIARAAIARATGAA